MAGGNTSRHPIWLSPLLYKARCPKKSWQKNLGQKKLYLKIGKRLETLAKETPLSRTEIAVKVIEQYQDVQEWQIRSIREAVVEADSPDAIFMDHDKVVAHMKKLVVQ